MSAAPLGILHVLLIDDNPNMRSIITTMLRAMGVGRISEAHSAEDAWSLLHRETFDFVIVDFRMDGMDGINFTRRLRNNPETPDEFLPVIMMSGHSERSRVKQARDSGITEYLAKPVKITSLMKRIEAVILRPRPFIRSADYFGPDRRRISASNHEGPWRRSTDLARIAIDSL